MTRKIVKLSLALAALLFGSAVGSQSSSDISLRVYDSSSIWWVAVDPINEGDQTAKVELQEASSSTWTEMMPNSGWGYWQLPSTSGHGFDLPLSFRLTDASGNQVTISDAMSTIDGGAVISTQASFGGSSSSSSSTSGHNTQAPTEAPTQEPTATPTHRPTTTPTENPTTAPTSAPTHTPTQEPTATPTHRPTATPTEKPTTAPTSAPTQRPTTTPTQKPTTAPTSAPTQRPTTTPTQKPTTAPTSAPTQRPTTAPTQKPTTAPSTTGSSTDLCTVTAASSEPLKMLVPLYVDPGSAWDELITAAASGVEIIAIINPDNGPVSSGPDSSYTTYMQKFANAGITMVGYVHTSYASRAASDVIADIDLYNSKYPGLAGIFVDEVATAASDVSYYQQLYTHIMGISGYVHDILNPGTQPDEGYVAVSTNIVIFEDVASNLKSNFASWVKCAPSSAEKAGYKYRFSGIAYAASSSEVSSLLSTMEGIGMGMVYVTDGSDACCVYNNLAAYFTQEAADIAALN